MTNTPKTVAIAPNTRTLFIDYDMTAAEVAERLNKMGVKATKAGMGYTKSQMRKGEVVRVRKSVEAGCGLILSELEQVSNAIKKEQAQIAAEKEQPEEQLEEQVEMDFSEPAPDEQEQPDSMLDAYSAYENNGGSFEVEFDPRTAAVDMMRIIKAAENMNVTITNVRVYGYIRKR